MNKPTHVMGGIALGVGIGVASSTSSIPLFGVLLAGTSIGAILPDIDKKNTSVSHKAPFISFITRLFTTHRGFTHSLLALAIFGSILYPVTQFGNLVRYLYYGLIIGYLSHLILDMLNPEGIPLFFPIKFKISFAKIRTGGKMESLFRWGLFVIIAISLLKYFRNDVAVIHQIMENGIIKTKRIFQIIRGGLW